MLVIPSFLVFMILCATAVDAYFSSWASSSLFQYAGRTQRDISINQTIDQLTFTGLNLNSYLWDQEGYKTSTLTSIGSYLSLGINLFAIDIYWNEKWQNWQLCPEPLLPNVTDFNQVQQLGNHDCQLGLNLTMVFNTINNFLDDTNTQLNANIVELFFNMKSLDSNYKYGVSRTNNSLSNLLTTSMSYVYTSGDWQQDQNTNYLKQGEFPTLSQFLYTKYKRVIPIVLSNNIPSNSTYGSVNDVDGDELFLNDYNLNVTAFTVVGDSLLTTDMNLSDQISKFSEQKFRITTDDNSDNFSTMDLSNNVHEGFSPILSEKSNLSQYDIIDNSLWSWATNQPNSSSSISDSHTNLTDSNTRQVANRCGVYYQGSWTVENCYNKRFVACRNESSVFDWKISHDRNTYFDADCPYGYIFGVPKSSLENLALRNEAIRLKISTPLWIDINSISVENCWVTGGPYATCPYEYVVTKKLFRGMISPAVVVIVILLFLFILLRFDNVPIQKNRKHWKKLVYEFNEKDYEGVPS